MEATAVPFSHPMGALLTRRLLQRCCRAMLVVRLMVSALSHVIAFSRMPWCGIVASVARGHSLREVSALDAELRSCSLLACRGSHSRSCVPSPSARSHLTRLTGGSASLGMGKGKGSKAGKGGPSGPAKAMADPADASTATEPGGALASTELKQVVDKIKSLKALIGQAKSANLDDQAAAMGESLRDLERKRDGLRPPRGTPAVRHAVLPDG